MLVLARGRRGQVTKVIALQGCIMPQGITFLLPQYLPFSSVFCPAVPLPASNVHCVLDHTALRVRNVQYQHIT
jgi:hypothetical protein